MSFTNKIVIVTGASRGIGASTAIHFAKEDANVVIVGRNEEKLNKVYAECEQFGNKHLMIKADVSKDDDAESIIKKTIDTFGKLDVLVNNAGILRRDDITGSTFMDTFDEVMNTNTRAVVVITKLAVPYLVETKGNIINVSSIAATTAKTPKNISYRVSKAALNHFTRCVALELAPHGVRVNSVSPGPVATDIIETSGFLEHMDEIMQGNMQDLKLAQPEEIADVILFLASDKARSITGSDYVSDNGYALK